MKGKGIRVHPSDLIASADYFQIKLNSEVLTVETSTHLTLRTQFDL